MSKNQVFKKLLATRRLPTPSTIALEIMRLSASTTASLNDIADIVEKDPALSGKLLEYANASLFTTASPVASIRKAIVRLGTDIVMGLALGFSLLSKNKGGRCEHFDYGAFWSSSLAMAVAARGLAELRPGCDPDELFICGLLSQIGRLAMASLYPPKYSEILAAGLSDTELKLQENKEFGIDHAEVSMELFREWGLPKKYIEAIALLEHRTSEDSVGGSELELLSLLRLSKLIARICMMEQPLKEKVAAVEEQAAKIAISPEEFNTLFDRIITCWQEWSYLFQIPARECSSFARIKSMGIGDPGPITTENQTGFCILAVDDDPLTLRILESLLAKSATTVLTAENGDDALRLALHYQPDLVITDWHMPKMSGIELCMTLRKTEFAKHLYIIMLTGNESDDELVQAFQAGADDYVVKPFNPKVLEARIRGGKRLIGYQEKMNQDRTVIQDYADKLSTANKKLHTMAMTDELTGLPNRRCAMERLEEMMAESKRFGNNISCIMIDIDHFKQINDTYGHNCGDVVLQKISIIFKTQSRAYDIISRIGGEEFLVISARNSQQESTIFAERLRQAVAQNEIAINDQTIRITISLGVAAMTPEMSEGNALILMADRALYRAKKNGRNRVEPAGGAPAEMMSDIDM
jgi:two-component system, cell cycle response regulator